MSDDSEIILTNSGQPFQDERTAKFAAKRKGIEDTHEPVQAADGNGWILKRISRSESTAEAAVSVTVAADGAPAAEGGPQMTVEELLGSASATAERPFDTEPPGETYWWVMISGARGASDDRNCFIGVNGQSLLVQREKRVPLPGRYVRALNDARIPQFNNETGKLNTIVGWSLQYPFTVLGRALCADFIRWRAEGTAINREATMNLKEATLRQQAAQMG